MRADPHPEERLFPITSFRMKRFISMSIKMDLMSRMAIQRNHRGEEHAIACISTRDLMVRSAAQRRVSNHGSLRPSFETPRKRAAPQDKGSETRCCRALLRMRSGPPGEQRRAATRVEP